MDKEVNAIATSNLVEATEKLPADGLHCLVESMAVPQGPSLDLHVTEMRRAVVAA